MENLLLPSKIEFQALDKPNTADVVITPCYHGYGTTLGNALRRVLLSSLPGAAVESFKIRGVQHEFGSIDGVKEDVVEVMLNLKQLVVKAHIDEPVTLSLSKKGPGAVTAADFDKNSNVEIFNPELVIANLTSAKPFDLEITVGRGRGFKTTEQKDKSGYDLGTIVVDSIYSPVKDVGYHVEYTRVGDITNYEKLVLSIETNGTITPRDAVFQSTQILMDHFSIVLTEAESGLADEAAAVRVTAAEKEAEVDGDKTEKGKKKVKAAKKKTKKED
ncbi:MAG: DNA-directed RNA polymerase subunit alpha [Patescibacteria group bacterium]|nr:DNA-directed RNA polymerase subunit alpha [Patescibacteria group bacterium]